MVQSSHAKPFYLYPPWIILFELDKHKIQPWRVNLSFLLTSFLDEMNKQGSIDFRASGMILDSSATVYLMKSELLLKSEDPPKPPLQHNEFLPPPLIFPLRYELTSTTIKHLLEVLDDALNGERHVTMNRKSKPVLPTPPKFHSLVDLYLMEIDNKMTELLNLIRKLVDKGKLILFSEIITGMEKMVAIKTFITLLFLAQKGKLTLWQEEDQGDIFITLMEASSFVEDNTETTWGK